MISSDIKDMPEEFQNPEYDGRAILVKKFLKIVIDKRVRNGYNVIVSEAIFHGLTARPFTMWALSLPAYDHVLFSSLPVLNY